MPAERQHEGVLAVLKPLLEIVVVAIFVMMFLVQPIRIPSASMQPTLLVGDLLLIDKQSFAPAGKLDRLLLPAAHVRRGDLAVFHAPGDRVPGNAPGTSLVGNLLAGSSLAGNSLPGGSLAGSSQSGDSLANERGFLIKRVVGVPGDRLRMREGHVLLEGQPLAEPYAFYAPAQPNNFRDDFPSLREADPDVEPGWWIELRRIAPHGELTIPQDSYFVLGDNRNDSEDSRYWGLVPRDTMVGRPLLVYFSQRSPEDAESTASLLQRVHDLLHMERHSLRVVR